MQEDSEKKITLLARVAAAAFYGFTSFFIIVANKVILTSYKFPSFQFLGLAQMVTGVVALFTAKQLSLIKYPDFAPDIFQRIWPLPVVFVGNLLCGLGGTKKISLPMFTVLRRFSILFTMIAEFWILGIKASKAIQLSVYLMIAGALVAGVFDLSFDTVGYVLIFINNVCTAANMVYTKKKLDAKDLGKYGLLFYNSVFMIIPVFCFTLYMGDMEKAYYYEHWGNPLFLVQFLLSCVLGFVLNYSIVLCTQVNSALTTTIIGVLKNLIVTYIGMVLGGDYKFSWLNFIGLNVSVIGSVIYTYLTFKRPAKPVVLEIVKPAEQV
ncbi:UDP-sugar transporter sqv-7-like [Mya arenaria]|uniref:UDP-sugar transporter sqv-7-like n=1 Tax=Mya arenaria TaxID=6604 RepID=UPI0022E62209|nr:UDP-sugar transporter sqv-7-like [Mya arenaria]